MIYKTFILTAILCVFSISCSEDILDRFTMFNITNTTNFSIPPTAGISLLPSIDTPEIQSDSNNQFENNNSRKDLIESAKLTSLTLEIEAPESQDFDFLNAIEIFISSENLEERLIASLTDIPENQSNTLNLEVVDVELASYLRADTYNLRVSARTDKTIASETSIKVTSNFFIDAKILGI